jgi:hypothetical protein
MISIDESDALKIYDALAQATTHHKLRDECNARLHMSQCIRYSPLTTALDAQCDRLGRILKEAEVFI